MELWTATGARAQQVVATGWRRRLLLILTDRDLSDGHCWAKKANNTIRFTMGYGSYQSQFFEPVWNKQTWNPKWFTRPWLDSRGPTEHGLESACSSHFPLPAKRLNIQPLTKPHMCRESIDPLRNSPYEMTRKILKISVYTLIHIKLNKKNLRKAVLIHT